MQDQTRLLVRATAKTAPPASTAKIAPSTSGLRVETNVVCAGAGAAGAGPCAHTAADNSIPAIKLASKRFIVSPTEIVMRLFNSASTARSRRGVRTGHVSSPTAATT